MCGGPDALPCVSKIGGEAPREVNRQATSAQQGRNGTGCGARRHIRLHRPQERLVKCKKHRVELVDVVAFALDKVTDNHIELRRRGKAKAGTFEQVIALAKRELERDGERHCRGFSGFVALVSPDLAKELARQVRALVNLDDSQTTGIDKRQDRLRE